MRRLTGVIAAILVGVGIMGITPALGGSSRANNQQDRASKHQYSDYGDNNNYGENNNYGKNNNGSSTQVPELSAILLLGSGLAGLVLYGIRGTKK